LDPEGVSACRYDYPRYREPVKRTKPVDPTKHPYAVALRRLGGLKGGARSGVRAKEAVADRGQGGGEAVGKETTHKRE
jgi:hypothetical protein